MAGQTPRFNLNFFGGDTAGTLDDDSDKFTGDDRLHLDRILAAFEGHNHRVTATLDEPDDAPLAVVGTGGQLEAGQTYSYVFSFVNADGLETVSSDEVSVDTPDILETPDAPQGFTDDVTAGTLLPGQYFYALSGLRGAEESAQGLPTAVTVLAGEVAVTLTLPALDDADEYQIWRMKDTDPGWTRVGTSSTGTFVDDGSVPAGAYGDPANDPPLVSDGINNYSVTVTLTGADITSAQASIGWKLYRTETSGVYSAASLVHMVVEREDELDPLSPLLTEWIDDGDASLVGAPKLFNQELSIPPLTFEYSAVLPATTGYPENYPILDATGLWVNKAGTWTSASAQRGRGVFTGTGAPSVMPAGALSGDLYIDLSNGDLYTL